MYVEAFFTAAVFVLTAVFVVVMIQRRLAVSRWEGSPEGARQRLALRSWILGKAEVVDVARGTEPAVVEAAFFSHLRGGRARRAFEERRRESVRLSLRIVTIAGDTVASEATVSIPANELTLLDVGKLITVLYDPKDPRRFHVDTLRRDAILLDGPTMRTRAAEEEQRARRALGK
ncbi:hypothetical protein BH09MYX1_BH09MYX1_20520 [soil metagenome]